MEIATNGQRSGRVARRVTNVLSVLLTLAALAFMAPSAFGLQRYVITGTSMGGTIDRGSVAFEEVVSVSELEVGDIITYTPPPSSGIDELVTHRIVKIRGTTFRTKGDAVPQPDPWKFELDADTQARVTFTVPYVGWIFIALADRVTRILVIGVPAGLIFLLSLAQVVRVLRRRPDAALPTEAAARSRDSVPAGG